MFGATGGFGVGEVCTFGVFLAEHGVVLDFDDAVRQAFWVLVEVEIKARSFIAHGLAVHCYLPSYAAIATEFWHQSGHHTVVDHPIWLHGVHHRQAAAGGGEEDEGVFEFALWGGVVANPGFEPWVVQWVFIDPEFGQWAVTTSPKDPSSLMSWTSDKKRFQRLRKTPRSSMAYLQNRTRGPHGPRVKNPAR